MIESTYCDHLCRSWLQVLDTFFSHLYDDYLFFLNFGYIFKVNYKKGKLLASLFCVLLPHLAKLLFRNSE